jgi:hypothetical protein
MRQESPITVGLKKAWPAMSRIINSIIYLIATVIKATVKTIQDQIKGGLG